MVAASTTFQKMNKIVNTSKGGFCVQAIDYSL
jgi:hypothetical protein